jgi:ribosomal protein S18 acetylase RimI-like enzyme
VRRIRGVAGAVWRRARDLPLYRRLGRKVMSGIAVREASDADRLAAQRWLNPHGEPVSALQGNPYATDWVADHLGQIAGFVQMVRHPPEHLPYTGYWLFSLCVRPHWQGLGIGERLSQAVIAQAATEGAQTLDLLVFEDNARAIGLYRKLGFALHTNPDLEPELECGRNPAGHRRVVMRKQLAGPK